MGKILRFIGLAVLVLFVTSFAVNAYNSNPSVILSRVLKNKDVNPQILTYRIYAFGLLPVGKAVFYNAESQKLNGQDVYHVRAEASTSELIAPFFKAQASLDSYINYVDYNPVLFKQKITILGKPSQEKEVIYDQKEGTMVLVGVKRQVLPNTQDPLSLMFNLRKIDFDKNNNIEMGINTNQRNYVLMGQVVAKEITLGGIKYKAYIAKADIRRRDKNNPYHQSHITVWFVKGKENIPILIKVSSGGVFLIARLTSLAK